MKNKNRKVLVTGGAVRIGNDICSYLAENNFDIIIHCNNSINEAERLLIDIRKKYSGEYNIIRGDLTDPVFQKKLFKEKIDILINNASCYDNKPLEIEKLETAKKQFEVNFWVPYNLMKKFREQKLKDGIIINILDCNIYKTDIISGSYLLSKKALAELTKMAALQWAPSIRVNGIAPGFTLPPVGLVNSKMEKSIQRTPLKKAVKVRNISETCLYIINNLSLTGEVICVDGGIHL